MIGDIIFSRFPFADQAKFKERPSLAVSNADERGDLSVLKISSKDIDRDGRVLLKPEDFEFGRLSRDSAVDLSGITRINAKTVTRYVGKLKPQALQHILKSRICSSTREFSSIAHAQNRPGNDPMHPHNLVVRDVSSSSSGEKGENSELELETRTGDASGVAVPYAGRVFTEDEVEAAVSATLDFWLTLGEHGEAMQQELAATLGVKKCLLVNSGSSANLIAVAALTTHKLPEHKRIKPGDEIITCAAGFPTTVAPILQNGAVPVFIDNDPITGNARMDQLEAAFVEGKTKAVIFAHTLGNPFDLATVCEFCHKHDLYLIEDNCDALGCTYTLPLEKAKAIGLQHLIKQAVRVDSSSSVKGPVTIHTDSNSKLELLTAPTGSFGDISTQSFYPPHHLTMGEGGSVNIIRRPPLGTYAESFRDWGRDCWCPSGKDNTCNKRFGWQLGELPDGYDHKYIYSHLGYNVKPLDPQAAIGRQQIKKLPAFIEARKQNWEYLRQGLEGLEKYFEFSLPTHAVRWVSPSERMADGGGIMANALESVFEWEDGSIDSGTPSSAISHHSSNLSNQSSFISHHSSLGLRVSPSWFGFMLLVKSDAPFTKSAFAAYLDENKVGNRMLFGGNLLRQPAFVQLKKDRPDAIRTLDFSEQKKARTENSNSELSTSSAPYPGADRIMNEAIFIGTYPGLTKLQLDYMIKTIKDFVESQI